MAFPWQGWLDQGWRGSLLVVAVLLLRGLPAVLAVRPLLEALRAEAKHVHFLGWFGSIGPTALYETAGPQIGRTQYFRVLCKFAFRRISLPRTRVNRLRNLFGRGELEGRSDWMSHALDLAMQPRCEHGTLLGSRTWFQEPELFLSLFTRDPAATVYSTCDLCVARMLRNTPTTQSHLRLSLALSQRRRVGDYLVEQEQRETDE
jgi:hypothetical protein